MSFMRFSSESKWEDVDPLYVYMSVVPEQGDSARLAGFDGATDEQVVEVVMRMLDQSGELSEDELQACHGALRSRLRLDDGDTGRNPPTAQDAVMGVSTAVVYADHTDQPELEGKLRGVIADLRECENDE